MAFSAADVTNLQAAIASGELVVKHNGKSVTYRSIAELSVALKKAQRSLKTTRYPSGVVGFSRNS